MMSHCHLLQYLSPDRCSYSTSEWSYLHNRIFHQHARASISSDCDCREERSKVLTSGSLSSHDRDTCLPDGQAYRSARCPPTPSPPGGAGGPPPCKKKTKNQKNRLGAFSPLTTHLRLHGAPRSMMSQSWEYARGDEDDDETTTGRRENVTFGTDSILTGTMGTTTTS